MSSSIRAGFPSWALDPEWANSPQKKKMDEVIKQNEAETTRIKESIPKDMGVDILKSLLGESPEGKTLSPVESVMGSPLGALLQGKPQEFMPRVKQRGEFFVEHPENISFGGDMAMRGASVHIPKPGSPEQFIEKTGEWKPGGRAQFDTAMMAGNANKIRQLLPSIPKEYQVRFADEIMKLLMGK